MENIEYLKIQNQLFCTQFELETLAGTAIRDELERWVPGFTCIQTELEHQTRYGWASQFVAGKKVLDIACGCGYGSAVLAERGDAKSVLGCDIEKKAVKYATIKHKIHNVNYIVGDAQEFSADSSFEVIVSFETIEHLSDPRKFLKNMDDLLVNGGLFLISTPISYKDEDLKPYNPYHRIEWGINSFQKLVGEYFEVEKVLVQLSPFCIIKANLWKILFPPRISRIRHTIKFVVSKLSGQKKQPLSEALKPKPWNPKDNPARELGKDIFGQQILVCRKKRLP
jgi:2-polyprenyl-3-methyl-5-hydroxy-6-metoxy-1,4-benzoquinol methylase